MSDINIENTDQFSKITAYLNDVSLYLDSKEKELMAIGNSEYGSVRHVFDVHSSSVKNKISNLQNKVNEIKSHIDKSLGIYYVADEELSRKLNDVYDSIFNNEEYESKLLYVASGEDKKISYEEFMNLVNNSSEYFNKQRDKVYSEFLTKMVTAGPNIIKKLGTNVYNAVVESTYLCISNEKYGSNEYVKGLANFKNKFAKEINGNYSNIDFVPTIYLKNLDEYNKALLTLSFDPRDDMSMRDLLWDTFNKIDERTKSNEYGISQVMYNVDAFYSAKDVFTDVPTNATPKELLDYYTNAVNELKIKFNLSKDETTAITGYDYNHNPNVWYETIKNTEAFKKIKDLMKDDKNEIFKLTNTKEFLAAVYQYDGINALQDIYYKYINSCLGGNVPKEEITNGDLSNIIQYAISKNMLVTLSEPVHEARSNLNTIDDSENTALLLFAKDLDTSDITPDEYKKLIKDVDGKWRQYSKNYEKYLEDWQLKAYAKLMKLNPDIAYKLFNKSEGADRGILNEKIMEGAAFDDAKYRVSQMTYNDNDGWNVDEYFNSILFSTAYGFGYGITDFTTGIVDVFAADGKKDRRQMEKDNIMALLATDYSLQEKYYYKDPDTMKMFNADYTDINIKLENFSSDEITDFINYCKEKKLPRYELEYYLGNITYDEYIKYKSIANLSEEDLKFYANLNKETGTRWWADKLFKVSNSVGYMAIPTTLSILASATGPVGGVPVSATMKTLSLSASLLSTGSLFASSLGRNREALMQSGETNEAYIWVNSILHASLESFGELMLGKVLPPTPVGDFVKQTAAKNHPILRKLIYASDNLENFLLRHNCNPGVAKYFSNIVGEVIQENMENIAGHGIDTATALIKQEIDVPTFDELLAEAWETTWMTALTTPILNGMTQITLSNVPRTININGNDVTVSVNDLLRFTDSESNTLDYQALSEYLIREGRMNPSILGEISSNSDDFDQDYFNTGASDQLIQPIDNLEDFDSPYTTSTWEEFTADNPLSQGEANAINSLIENGFIRILEVRDNKYIDVVTPNGKRLLITKEGLTSQNFQEAMKIEAIANDQSLLVNDWLLDQIERMDQTIPARNTNDFKKSSLEIIQEQLNDVAKRLNISPEEAQKLLDNKLAQFYGESDVGIRVSNEVIEKILDSEFKNQHQTGASDGLNNPDIRKKFESYIMGLGSIDDSDAPIYGHLFPNKNTDEEAFIRYAKTGQGSWYGRGNQKTCEAVAIIDKEKTQNYTTLTMGDSLDYGRRNVKGHTMFSREGFIQSPTSAANPHFTGADPNILSTFNSIDELSNISLEEFTGNSIGDGYIETQIYGKLNHGIDIIKELVFLSKPSQELMDKLDALSIPYTVIE